MRDWTAIIAARMRAAGHAVDADIVEELAQHAAAVYHATCAEGASVDAAAAAVDEQITLWVQEAPRLHRRPRRVAAIEPPPAAAGWAPGLAQDVRYAWRLVRRQPAFTLLLTGTTAIGIAATTTLFSVTYGVLARPLPWPEADRLVLLKETRGGSQPRFNSFSNAAYLAWADAPVTVEGIAAWAPRTLTLTGTGDPERIRAIAATASLFRVLGVRPLLGSVFEPANETRQDGAVVVLAEGLWRQRFGADPAVLGHIIQLEGQPHRVIGVLPAAGAYPDETVRAWVPFRVNPTTGNFVSMFEAIARLRPGIDAVQAAGEGTTRALAAPPSPDLDMTIRAIFGTSGPARVEAVPLRDALTADVRRPLLVLLAAVGLLFLAAIGNVASLQLARSTTRRREMAIRAALGAGGARITRQLLVECTLLGLAGGAAGLALAAVVHRVLPAVLPADFPRLTSLALDGTVVAFTVLVALLASLAIGLLPAFRARRLDLTASLAEGGSAPVGAGVRTRTGHVRTVIMAGQVAIACVLLVGASLLGRSFWALVTTDRGFDPAHVFTARVQLPKFAYSDARRAELIASLTRRLKDVPAVTAVTHVAGPPLGASGGTAFMIDARRVQAAAHTVVPGYFAAMGTRILDGRDFTPEDIAGERPVFIVNEAFVRQYLGHASAGQRVRGWVRKGSTPWEIIAIVENVRHRGLTEPPEPAVYLYQSPEIRLAPTAPTFIIRTSGDPAAFAPTFRSLAKEQDASIVVDSMLTLEDRVLTTLARPRLYAILLGGFAGLALLIAAVGLFGVLSYSVAQRSRELAVRSALGARPVDIVRLVVGQGLVVTAAGLLAGLLGAAAAARVVGRLLYGVQPYDPLTFVAVPIVLIAVAAAASILPARRAARVDPLSALRAG